MRFWSWQWEYQILFFSVGEGHWGGKMYFWGGKYPQICKKWLNFAFFFWWGGRHVGGKWQEEPPPWCHHWVMAAYSTVSPGKIPKPTKKIKWVQWNVDVEWYLKFLTNTSFPSFSYFPWNFNDGPDSSVPSIKSNEVTEDDNLQSLITHQPRC